MTGARKANADPAVVAVEITGMDHRVLVANHPPPATRRTHRRKYELPPQADYGAAKVWARSTDAPELESVGS